ncbi:MAG: homoserine kinase [Acidobacteria bacterium]|nr:homoserine kinase [Acidobacteriota bacterium]
MDQRIVIRGTAIQVRVPASSANLGPGFDALALALGLYLRCSLRPSREGLRIRASGADSSAIPPDKSNLIWRAFLRLAGEQHAKEELELEIVNEIPLGRGLGSSAAAIVAGLALANEWLGLGRSRDQLIQAATEMEGHPDNVAAAVRGGLVVSCQADDGSVLTANARFPKDVEAVLVVPQYQLSTEAARAVLPAQYSRRDAVFNLQRVALLLASLGEGRTELLAEALRDRLHQPWRAPLLPGFTEILKLRNIPGLLGVALSGAGPAVVAFCRGRSLEVGEAIVACFRRQNIEATALRLPVDEHGLVVERLPQPDAAVEAI